MKLTRAQKRDGKTAVSQAIGEIVKVEGSISLGDYYKKRLPVSLQPVQLWGTNGYFVNEVKQLLSASGYHVESVKKGGTTISLPSTMATGNIVQENGTVIGTVSDGGLFPVNYKIVRLSGKKAVFTEAGFIAEYEPRQLKKLPKILHRHTTVDAWRGIIERGGKQFFAYLQQSTDGMLLYVPETI